MSNLKTGHRGRARRSTSTGRGLLLAVLGALSTAVPGCGLHRPSFAAAADTGTVWAPSPSAAADTAAALDALTAAVARSLAAEELSEVEVWVQGTLTKPFTRIPDHFEAAMVGAGSPILLREDVSSVSLVLAHELAHLSLARLEDSAMPWSLEEALCQHVAHRCVPDDDRSRAERGGDLLMALWGCLGREPRLSISCDLPATGGALHASIGRVRLDGPGPDVDTSLAPIAWRLPSRPQDAWLERVGRGQARFLVDRAVEHVGWDATLRLLVGAHDDVTARLLAAAELPDDTSSWGDAILSTLDTETLAAWLSLREPAAASGGGLMPATLVRRLTALYGRDPELLLDAARPGVRLEDTDVRVALHHQPAFRREFVRAWRETTPTGTPLADSR